MTFNGPGHELNTSAKATISQISPLVSGIDSQSVGSDFDASGSSNLLNEQLREFESVFMRVASSNYDASNYDYLIPCRNNSQTYFGAGIFYLLICYKY
jgi:hypothetical protein